MSTIDKPIKRGDVFWVNLNPTIGSEINKTRPAVVVSNNTQNIASSRVIVLPITSSVLHLYPFESKVKIDNKIAKATADQIRTIDKSRLKQYICTVSRVELEMIDKAIKIVLSLS